MTPAPTAPADLVITGCTVLVHDEHERICFTQDAAVVVRDGVVEAVTRAADLGDLSAVEHIDARGQVALPGLINCHTHSPMAALRGIAEDLPVEEWFNDYVWAIESNPTEKDIELGARLACADARAWTDAPLAPTRRVRRPPRRRSPPCSATASTTPAAVQRARGLLAFPVTY